MHLNEWAALPAAGSRANMAEMLRASGLWRTKMNDGVNNWPESCDKCSCREFLALLP